MKKDGILNNQLSRIVALMGHGDLLTISDAGLPIPSNVELVDLAVSRNIPSFIEVLNTVLIELDVESIIIANETKIKNPVIFDHISKIFSNKKIVEIAHEDFKEKIYYSKAVIKTGEFSPYANIILVSGVVF